MKKKSPPYAIILAVVLGIIAIVAFIKWKQVQDDKTAAAVAEANKEAQAKIDEANKNKAPVVVSTPTNMHLVLYATQPVEPGVQISSAFFEKKLTPTDILPDAYTDKDDIVGWIATRKIEKGDPLTPRNIGKSLPYLSQRIPPGMREISLPIFNAEVNDTGGYIVDGDRVDLLYSTLTPGGTAMKVETVMQNLTILSVPGSQVKTDKTEGITPVPPPGDAISVTFEVTPEQAEALLFLAQVKTGKFSMILRGRNDHEVAKIKPFEATDYADGFKKVQLTADKSIERVKELAAKIEDESKKQSSEGKTNETPNPTAPNP